MSAPTALYRRYRPDSFAEVIGQEHVTGPLMTALDKNRVNHAYLFSGPRGCGKTTSARILARCLNCAKGPTSHPCGECDSCLELARGGAGSLDVIEIDAASHGGVDDARDLRERATFAPIRDRYKIFIIDEAHMVTSAGFNALLKIVEEPPEHIKFIFATTEPDKVIGTIRSRTHHYPFRLVPPEPLMAYLAQLCEQEGVAVAPGVLSLVVRAGGGSVRDSLSVLDQLMAGAGASGLNYDLAVELLGYTHASLLDDVVDALAANDSATVFKSVDRVIQTGHDPRRFVEDLLERFRDLIIVQAMPESAHAILRGTPDELIARMQTQAAQLGPAELSRAADVTNAAFNEMTGATSPRLHLELLGARLLLPGADASMRGLTARMDQLERRLNYGGAPGVPTAAPTAPDTTGEAPAAHRPTAVGSVASRPAAESNASASNGGLAAVRAELARARETAGAEVAARTASPASTKPVPSTNQDGPTSRIPAPRTAEQPAPASASVQQPAPASAPAQPAPASADAASSGSTSGIEMIRRAWPEILGALRNIRMVSWVIVNQNVVPQTFDGQELRVGLPSSGLIATFRDSGHLENLQHAINTVLGISVQIHPADGEAPKASAEPNPKVPTGNTAERTAARAAAPTPAAAAAPVPAPVPAAAESSAIAVDSWGLPAEQQAAAPAAAAPARQEARQDAHQKPWDGPSEPSDYWDEPDSDVHPPSDPWVQSEPENPTAEKSAPAEAQPAHTLEDPAPGGSAAYTPPRVSPISAWTTGWDTPSDPITEVVVPAEAQAPRRSAQLAEQAAKNTGGNAASESAEEWGSSLGHTRRSDVSDPGWGAMSAAPDWAQTAAPRPHQDPVPPQGSIPHAEEVPTPGAPVARQTAPPPLDSQGTAENGTVASEPMSMYQRLANSPAAQAARAELPEAPSGQSLEDVPSPDDVTIEESGVVGQAAVERILGGVLVEERPLTLPN